MKRSILTFLVVVTLSILSPLYALTSTPVAFGTIGYFPLFNGPADVRIGMTTMNPGETNGWHRHPGVVYVIVASGSLTFESGCGDVETYTAGQAFSERDTDIHRAVNYGSVPLVFYGTVIVPAGGPTKIPYPGPLCGPPVNADACKNDGWRKFDYPRTFANQGDCVSFTEHGN